MGKSFEISIQQLDEWIAGATDCQLLSKPDLFALCNKVVIIIH